MADQEKILAIGALAEELLKIFQGGLGGERGGVQDLGFVAGLSADERGGLEAALEGAGDDEVELDVQRVLSDAGRCARGEPASARAARTGCCPPTAGRLPCRYLRFSASVPDRSIIVTDATFSPALCRTS